MKETDFTIYEELTKKTTGNIRYFRLRKRYPGTFELRRLK